MNVLAQNLNDRRGDSMREMYSRDLIIETVDAKKAVPVQPTAAALDSIPDRLALGKNAIHFFGKARSCVVIDKLPFAPPDDPLLAARLERLRATGGNPFRDHQLPQAAIALKQGAGRLIRTETDRGVLMICDPRLAEKPYGKLLWRSLPPMARTRSLDDAVRFLASTP